MSESIPHDPISSFVASRTSDVRRHDQSCSEYRYSLFRTSLSPWSRVRNDISVAMSYDVAERPTHRSDHRSGGHRAGSSVTCRAAATARYGPSPRTVRRHPVGVR